MIKLNCHYKVISAPKDHFLHGSNRLFIQKGYWERMIEGQVPYFCFISDPDDYDPDLPHQNKCYYIDSSKMEDIEEFLREVVLEIDKELVLKILLDKNAEVDKFMEIHGITK